MTPYVLGSLVKPLLMSRFTLDLSVPGIPTKREQALMKSLTTELLSLTNNALESSPRHDLPSPS